MKNVCLFLCVLYCVHGQHMLYHTRTGSSTMLCRYPTRYNHHTYDGHVLLVIYTGSKKAGRHGYRLATTV